MFTRTSLILLACSFLMAAEVADMSGTWSLNTKRSRWGKMPQPSNIELRIEHKEPAFTYSGTINRPDEAASTSFEFHGAIDGKEYDVKEDNKVQRKIAFERKNDRTITSKSHFPDGRGVETSVMTLSRDGRTLSREMEFKPKGASSQKWTEIYEKKN
jgi:hypothetical protein